MMLYCTKQRITQLTTTVCIFLSISSINATTIDAYGSNTQTDDSTQAERNICGQLALIALSQYIGEEKHTEKVFEALPANGQPISMQRMLDGAHTLGLNAVCKKWTNWPSQEFTYPSIVLFDQNTEFVDHYVLLMGESKGQTVVFDPASGPYSLDNSSIKLKWNGVAIHFNLGSADLNVTKRGQSLYSYNYLLICLTTGLLLAWIVILVVSKCSMIIDLRPQPSIKYSILTIKLMMLMAAGLYSANSIFRDNTAVTLTNPSDYVFVEPKHQEIDSSLIPRDASGKIMVHYNIKNNFSFPLTISEVSSSCSCISFEPEFVPIGAKSVQPFVAYIKQPTESSISQNRGGTTKFTLYVKFKQLDDYALTISGLVKWHSR